MFEMEEDLLACAWVRWVPFVVVAELLPVVRGLPNGDETPGSSI
jgi:hypothetical protein